MPQRRRADGRAGDDDPGASAKAARHKCVICMSWRRGEEIAAGPAGGRLGRRLFWPDLGACLSSWGRCASITRKLDRGQRFYYIRRPFRGVGSESTQAGELGNHRHKCRIQAPVETRKGRARKVLPRSFEKSPKNRFRVWRRGDSAIRYKSPPPPLSTFRACRAARDAPMNIHQYFIITRRRQMPA